MPSARKADRPRPAVLALLGLAALLSGFLVLWLADNLTFIYDDWDLLINRRGWNAGSFLDLYHEHIVLLPTLFFKVLAALFGIGSAVPFHVVATGVFISSAVVFFVHVRTLFGDWGALIGATSILLLGASFENLFGPSRSPTSGPLRPASGC